MYALSSKLTRPYQAVAMLILASLLLGMFSFNVFYQSAEAANVTNVSDTLSDSAPSSVSNHTIAFTVPNGMLIGETFTITFPAFFDASTIVIGDVDLSTTTAETLAGASDATSWGVSGFGSNTLTFETPTGYGLASSTALTVLIGDNASGGSNQIVNPATTTNYEITIGGTMFDSGATRVAIVDNVLMTASVSTAFDFVVTGSSTGATVNGSPTTTATTTTPTTLPFETLEAGTSKTLAHELQVTTNAANGFVVTIEQDSNLNSITGADIDGFIDGAYTDAPTAWVAPSNNISNENTWGHWGLTSEDTDLEGAGADFGSDQWISASTTPRAIFAHASSSDGTTPGIGFTVIGFQAQITALQEAADDYSTVLTYIATPTF